MLRFKLAMTAAMTPRTATLIGLTAILMWSLLSVMTVATGKIPAFQLAAMTFAIGAAVAFASFLFRPSAFAALKQPLVAWIVGVGGLFGYHALYFLALRFAPPAEAGLVELSLAAPDRAVLLAAAGRAAAGRITSSARCSGSPARCCCSPGRARTLRRSKSRALLAAFVAAFVWAAYSVMSRRLKAVPTDAVAGFCAATALLAAIVHVLVETTVWPETAMQWLAIIALGVGPVGAAFFTWDIGMKRGDIRVLGAASYATPLLSTAFLILAGYAAASANIVFAAILIAGGGLIAAKDMFWKR